MDVQYASGIRDTHINFHLKTRKEEEVNRHCGRWDSVIKLHLKLYELGLDLSRGNEPNIVPRLKSVLCDIDACDS
jgi:hypothetical protein